MSGVLLIVVRGNGGWAMSGNSADFSGNIPENYDNGMGPCEFRLIVITDSV
jgi:hypothetical protein